MPLSVKGKNVLRSMIEQYGSKKRGEQVFYASINKKVPGSEKWHSYKKGSLAEGVSNHLSRKRN